MVILLKACKPDNFELHNSLKLSFTNIVGLHSNFVDCQSFLESNSLDILALCETDLNDPNDSGNFAARGYLSLLRKDSSTHIHLSQCMWRKDFLLHRPCLQKTLQILTVFDRLYFAQCLASFSFINCILLFCALFLILFHLTLRFFRSTYLLTYLSLKTFTPIIRIVLLILVELLDLVNSVIIFLSQTTLLRWLTLLLGSQTEILTVLLFWIYLFLLTLVFLLQQLSLDWKILIMLLPQFQLIFHHIHNRMTRFIAWLKTILVLTVVFVIIWEMFHGRISLNSVLLLLLVNFVSGFRLEFMWISLIESIRSSVTHLHSF